MGITFDVESIIPVSNSQIPRQQYEIYKKIVWHIQKAFNWEVVPWQEPSEIKGLIDGSANYSRYHLLMEVAAEAVGLANRRLTSDKVAIPQNVKDPISLHLPNNYRFATFYLPVDFPQPLHFEDKQISDETFSVYPSISLAAEMKILERVIRANIEIFGAETVADPETLKNPNRAKHTWSGVYDLCISFLEGAEESQELNLPFHISY